MNSSENGGIKGNNDKVFGDDNLNVAENTVCVLYREKNVVGKGEKEKILVTRNFSVSLMLSKGVLLYKVH